MNAPRSIFLLAVAALCGTMGCVQPGGHEAAASDIPRVDPSAAIAIASDTVFTAEDHAWTTSAINVRTRIDALGGAGGVLRRSVAMTTGVEQPFVVPYEERPTGPAEIRIPQGTAARILSPSGRPSRSMGAANRGWLVDGARVPDGDAWNVAHPEEAYGTDYAVSELLAGLMFVANQFDDTPVVGIFDLSYEGGGASPPHRSHQSGRDVDMAFYRDPPGEMAERFVGTNGATLDAERQWALFRFWIERESITYLFVDRWLQPHLARQARLSGAPPDLIERAFGDPDNPRDGIIRHEPGHHDHVHVRFRCGPSDALCIE